MIESFDLPYSDTLSQPQYSTDLPFVVPVLFQYSTEVEFSSDGGLPPKNKSSHNVSLRRPFNSVGRPLFMKHKKHSPDQIIAPLHIIA
jgi:hypothetical protein